MIILTRKDGSINLDKVVTVKDAEGDTKTVLNYDASTYYVYNKADRILVQFFFDHPAVSADDIIQLAETLKEIAS